MKICFFTNIPVRMADDMISRAARLRESSPAFSSTNLAIEFWRLLLQQKKKPVQ